MAAGWHKFTGSSPYPQLSQNSALTSFSYGNKSDRAFRLPWIQGRRDADLEQEVVDWVEGLLGETKRPDQNLCEWLRDGRILCRVLEKTSPGALKHPINHKPHFASSQNVNNFLETVRSLGLPEAVIFELNDLYNTRYANKVVETLAYIKSRVKVQVY